MRSEFLVECTVEDFSYRLYNVKDIFIVAQCFVFFLCYYFYVWAG